MRNYIKQNSENLDICIAIYWRKLKLKWRFKRINQDTWDDSAVATRQLPHFSPLFNKIFFIPQERKKEGRHWLINNRVKMTFPTFSIFSLFSFSFKLGTKKKVFLSLLLVYSTIQKQALKVFIDSLTKERFQREGKVRRSL